MIDLDRYIEDELEIKIFGKIVHVKEITARMMSRINMVERAMNPKNIGEKRIEVAIIVLNNNREGITFTEENFENIPYAVVDRVANEISNMRKRIEEDPNSKSQSRKEK